MDAVTSVKRGQRLGIYPPTGKRKNPRIPKGEVYGAVLSKDAMEWGPYHRKHVHFHATKGFRGGEL